VHIKEIVKVIDGLPYEELLVVQKRIEGRLFATQTTQIGKFFNDAEKNLYLKFRGWENDIPHSGEKGGLRERRVADFLLSILPKRYGIGTGHIIDNEGNVSKQTDIVIYDALEGIVLPADDYYSLFPCECVYAAIEVKSTLSASDGNKGPSGTIYDCLKNTSRLKALKRDNKHHQLPPIISIVFSYQADKNWVEKPEDKIIDWFEDLSGKHGKNMPDIIFVLKPGFVIYPAGTTDNFYEKDGALTVIKWNSLLGFTSQLIRFLSQSKVAIPNLWYEYQYAIAKEGTQIGELHTRQIREMRRNTKLRAKSKNAI